MWLTNKQLRKLTGKKRPSAQIRVLEESRVQFRVVNGRPIVPNSEIDQNPASYQPKLRLAR